MTTPREFALDPPPAWLEGRHWLLVQALFTVSENGDVTGVAGGGVLSDGTNIIGLVYDGGQRLMRMSPDTDWALEEHFIGDPPADDGKLGETWTGIVESFRLGMADAKAELAG